MLLDYTNVTLDTLLETQVKFKVLYSYRSEFSKNENLIWENKLSVVKIFLKIIYTIQLKKVLSGKVTNRLVTNYFKKFLRGSEIISESSLKFNKTILDSNYISTLAINSIYELSSSK